MYKRQLRKAARFTDGLPLADYASILHLVPRLVNVVTVTRARFPSNPHAPYCARRLCLKLACPGSMRSLFSPLSSEYTRLKTHSSAYASSSFPNSFATDHSAPVLAYSAISTLAVHTATSSTCLRRGAIGARVRANPSEHMSQTAQLAEAIPVVGSGITLPLNLHAIGARCTNAYYAPKRFAAVQLAFSNPRCRVLVFHTGRLVGTGVP